MDCWPREGELPAVEREIGNLLPNNQRQRRTCYALERERGGARARGSACRLFTLHAWRIYPRGCRVSGGPWYTLDGGEEQQILLGVQRAVLALVVRHQNTNLSGGEGANNLPALEREVVRERVAPLALV